MLSFLSHAFSPFILTEGRHFPFPAEAGHDAIEGTHLRISKTIAGPKGTKFTAVYHGNTTTLINAADLSQSIVITAPPAGGGGAVTADVSISGVLGSIGDGLMEVLGALKKLVSCTPTQTTQINMGSDGKISSVVITQTCGPS